MINDDDAWMHYDLSIIILRKFIHSDVLFIFFLPSNFLCSILCLVPNQISLLMRIFAANVMKLITTQQTRHPQRNDYA